MVSVMVRARVRARVRVRAFDDKSVKLYSKVSELILI